MKEAITTGPARDNFHLYSILTHHLISEKAICIQLYIYYQFMELITTLME